MANSCVYLPYKNTSYFSKLVIDYIDQSPATKPFFEHPPSLEGLQAAIEARRKFPTDRQLLVNELRKQYAGISLTPQQEKSVESLLSEDTFTICTAHQPNIFTGHLYFIYKILHIIKLAQHLNVALGPLHFVPVYYMGSEDADLEELGHINLNGKKLEWETKQTGAVGRMKVDKQLIKLIDEVYNQLGVLPYGKDVADLLRSSYKEGTTIQQATLLLVNELFCQYGLLTLIPDNSELKKTFEPVVKRELLEQFSHPLVEETGKELSRLYKVQAGGREINLFYMTDGVRLRIVQQGDQFRVSGFTWSKEEMIAEVERFPERFSANVILRGVFQETILPNIAFIGGGGEIAYWLELKKVFEASGVPYPVLVVRNSFLILSNEQEQRIHKLGFETTAIFKGEHDLLNELVKRETTAELSLERQKSAIGEIYDQIRISAANTEITLEQHVAALKTKTLKTLGALEKKMLRAEKRKFDIEKQQIQKLKQQLFPADSLQERVDNFSLFYAKYGKEWFNSIYNASLTLEQQLGILSLG